MAKEHPPASGMRKTAFIFAEVSIAITMVVVAFYLLKYPGPLKKAGVELYANYNWHAALNTIAFVGFMFNAVMAFRMYPGSHNTRKAVHLLFHTIALGLSITAVVLMFKFHNANGIINLYSTHSIVGLAALIAFGFQWLCGVITYLMPSPAWLRFMALPMHKFLGIAVMIAVTTACVLGAMDRQRITWEVGPLSIAYNATPDKIANLYACLVLTSALFVGFVLNQASEKLPRKPDGNAPSDNAYRSLSVENPASSSYGAAKA